MEKLKKDDEEIQIDLLELLFAFKRKAWLIILAMIVGGAGAGFGSKMLMTPVYTSTAMVYVLSKETTLTSLADLQIGSQLTKDYRVIITSRPVLEQVIENQGLEMQYEDLKDVVTITNPTDTRILELTVSDSDPVRARAIANEVAKVSSDYIGDIMEMIPPKMIEEGVVALEPSSPSIKKNAALGGLGLAVLVCGAITLQVIMNDTVRSEEDVEKYLGLSVLASIPDDESLDSTKKSRKKAKGKEA